MIQELIEDWQIIKDKYNSGKFVVSDRGRVAQILSDGTAGLLIDIDEHGQVNKNYKTIWICNVKMYVHVLVATYFVPNPHGYSAVHHKDHNAKNNCVTNLEWTTQSYNNKLMHWNKTTKFDWNELKWTIKEVTTTRG